MTSPDNPVPEGADPAPSPPAVVTPPAKARRGRRRAVDEAAPQPSGTPPRPRARLFAPRPRWEKSGAGLVALVAFVWGMSLLVQEWLRTTWLEPRGLSASVLAAPFFAVAVAAAMLAARARSAGRPALGGPAIHRFGLASGLVGATALVLALYMAPRLLAVQDTARLEQARRQLLKLAAALDAHAERTGDYPEGSGAGALSVLGDGGRGAPATRDPWGRDLEYRSLTGSRGYLLMSVGRNGVPDVPMSDYLEGGRGSRGGDDLVVVSGTLRGGGFVGIGTPDEASARTPAPDDGLATNQDELLHEEGAAPRDVTEPAVATPSIPETPAATAPAAASAPAASAPVVPPPAAVRAPAATRNVPATRGATRRPAAATAPPAGASAAAAKPPALVSAPSPLPSAPTGATTATGASGPTGPALPPPRRGPSESP